jgi:pyridoxal phosphate enzyme (YggS family)
LHPHADASVCGSDAVATRLDRVRSVIADACERAGRHPGDVVLVAASKNQPDHMVEVAIAARHLVFGENRVQEAQEKWPAIRSRRPGVELHLIGPLQTNKTAAAVALFDVIQSVDRPSLCASLSREIAKTSRHPILFVQVNTGAEPQKSGVSPADVDRFIEDCQRQYGLSISGVMAVPPVGQNPQPHFALLAEIASRNGLRSLSMGMSGDYAAAIEAGATHVRIGTAVFGPRPDANLLNQPTGGT